jgi:hypothetical protein
VAICFRSDRGDVDLRELGNFVGCEVFGSFEDFIGDRLGCWAAIREVVLDTEIVLGSCIICDQLLKNKVIDQRQLPPGLWLAVRRIPPVALRFRMT